MSHDKWLVTYSLKESVTQQQYELFYERCKKADEWLVAKEFSQKLHCHAYLQFNKARQYIQVQRMFAGVVLDSKYSLQIKKAYNYGALEYCVKDGDYETNILQEVLDAGLARAKISKTKVKRGDTEQILFELCEYLEEHGDIRLLLRSPDISDLRQLWKDFCAYKKEWRYVDKAYICLRRLEYGAETLWSKWQAFQKESRLSVEEEGDQKMGSSVSS